jgi:hypothetical protein
MLTGGEIVEGFGSDGFYPMMGRAGGLNGSPLKEDLEKGTWKTHQYEVKSVPTKFPIGSSSVISFTRLRSNPPRRDLVRSA